MKKRPAKSSGARRRKSPKRDTATGLSNPTRIVDVASGRTITEFLVQQGLTKGVTLEDDVEYSAASILRVEGGRKYEIGRELAKGGMGIIHEARDLNCRRTVAMKVMPKETRSKTEDLLRFIEEAQITSQLEHPNIAPVHELGLDAEGNVFYTMKYVKGVTLTDVLNSLRAGDRQTIDEYPLARLLTIFQKACDGVAFAHSKGVIHRDLKPENIMIGEYGEVVVMDWGLAKVLALAAGAVPGPVEAVTGAAGPAATEAADTGVSEEKKGDTVTSIRTETGTRLATMFGRIMGTPGFMAPEQVRVGDAELDQRTDVYSLGAILYSILTLHSSIREKEIKEALKKILAGDIPPAVSFNGRGNLPHCPGGKVPEHLSAVAMKAMSVDPAERHATVKEFQQELEDYQNGQVWHLLVDEDFSDPEQTLARWDVVGGQYEFKDGEFRLYGGEPQILLFKRELPGDIRIEFECHQESLYLNDVGCFCSAVRSGHSKEVPASGYEFKHGGYDNSLNVLMRSDQKIWSQKASPLVRGKRFRVMAERLGPRLRMVVNDEEVFSVTDGDPLTGSDRTAAGLLGWMADTRYSRIRIYSRGTPWQSDLLNTAERHLLKGHYQTAKDLFREVMEAFPDDERLQRASKGYDMAVHRQNMVASLPVWQERLKRAWPDAPIQVRLDNDGLTVEMTNVGVEDLEPLRDMPITTLYCAGNSIRSLEPLRGMKLLKLDCSGNPVETLEPLSGMPLKTLICECCGLRTLAPLHGMVLTMLNGGGNCLADGLEPLRGMRLTWLACWGSGITGLSPLAGMPLTSLYCEANAIEDLAPLAGMPLNTLLCSGNRITSLEPLAGLQLTALHCGSNEIESLEPLRGMMLTMFSCHCNRIRSLEPLRGMPLGALICGGNKLSGIGSFIKNPPPDFFFECDTIPAEDLEWMRQAWSRDFRFAAHARGVEILLAARQADTAKLRDLAAEFRGHRYLFVPRLMRWHEAKAFCERCGGHLVTVTSQEENDFIASLFPRGSWFWIGLETTDAGQRWVTGEPFSFSRLIDPLREKRRGPKVYYSGAWSCDVFPEAYNCFMIEWDD
ncbi:MAG: protein kinase [Kiritimatiellae bacterium]|nr:protein kinase [Kiritimatiellia bacterium]